MSPRLRIAALVALTLAVPGQTPLAAARPNVLFFFTDDQRADTIGALGNPHVITPTLDRLAESGFVFRNAYVMGSNVGAVCLPSRNMLLSGRAYFRFHADVAAGKPTRAYASPEKPNFPDSMKQAGYVAYHHGKKGNVARLAPAVAQPDRSLLAKTPQRQSRKRHARLQVCPWPPVVSVCGPFVSRLACRLHNPLSESGLRQYRSATSAWTSRSPDAILSVS